MADAARAVTAAETDRDVLNIVAAAARDVIGARSGVARRGANAFAYENRCNHAAFPLESEDGRMLVQEKRYLVCAVHGASYDMTSGACAGGPCSGGLTPIPIEIVDGAVLIR